MALGTWPKIADYGEVYSSKAAPSPVVIDDSIIDFRHIFSLQSIKTEKTFPQYKS